jgi:hypothetical protein
MTTATVTPIYRNLEWSFRVQPSVDGCVLVSKAVESSRAFPTKDEAIREGAKLARNMGWKILQHNASVEAREKQS